MTFVHHPPCSNPMASCMSMMERMHSRCAGSSRNALSRPIRADLTAIAELQFRRDAYGIACPHRAPHLEPRVRRGNPQATPSLPR